VGVRRKKEADVRPDRSPLDRLRGEHCGLTRLSTPRAGVAWLVTGKRRRLRLREA